MAQHCCIGASAASRLDFRLDEFAVCTLESEDILFAVRECGWVTQDSGRRLLVVLVNVDVDKRHVRRGARIQVEDDTARLVDSIDVCQSMRKQVEECKEARSRTVPAWAANACTVRPVCSQEAGEVLKANVLDGGRA